MADIWSKEKRSQVMSLVRSHGNKATELRLINAFKAYEIVGWRRKQNLPGRPDFVFWKERACVFVDGCFWHGCPTCYRRPSSNRKYWDAKVLRNRQRDRMVVKSLRIAGWKVLRVWEHELTPANSNKCAAKVRRFVLTATAVDD